jgi:hypothetical protein
MGRWKTHICNAFGKSFGWGDLADAMAKRHTQAGEDS